MVAIGNSSLVLHAGAHAVTREQVFASETPDPTDTHFPVPHGMVIEQVQNSLADLGWRVTEEAHALLGDGLRYFGLLAIARSHGSADIIHGTDSTYQFVVGLRNAHDKSFASEGILGSRVFVCDNLAFSGTGSAVFKFSRKHTRYIERDLPGLVAGAFGRMAQGMEQERERIEAYRRFALPAGESQMLVHDLLVRAMQRRACTPQMLPHILHEWQREDGPGGFGREAIERGDEAFAKPTAWRLLNAFTEVEKRKPSPIAAPARNSRLIGLLDGLVGIHNDGPAIEDAVEIG
jgi:hypothetical protein